MSLPDATRSDRVYPSTAEPGSREPGIRYDPRRREHSEHRGNERG